MKTLSLLLLLVFSAIAGGAEAQAPLGFGFKVGSVAATQDWQLYDWDEPQETRWGVIAGVFVDVVDLPHFTVILEVDYVQKGAKLTWNETTVEGEVLPRSRPRVDYLSVPVLAKIHTDVGRFAPYIVVGPTLDVPFNTDFDGSSMLRAQTDEFKKVDVGAMAGFGIELSAHAVTPVAEFRYCYSLNEAIDTESLTIRNHYIALLLGARL